MTRATDVRRCLMTCDVAGLMPYLSQEIGPVEAFIALHIARVEAVTMPERLKRYSLAFLAERGIRNIAGRWTVDAPPQAEVFTAAGIASRSSDARLSQRIVRAMGDACLDALAAGITEPPIQKERMLKARARERFRMRIC
ncbi:MAG: hypothetical protein IOC86_16735 [Aestuariivirga sp.]|nr:hypothetical protein [Aestuariivirga sp.]